MRTTEELSMSLESCRLAGADVKPGDMSSEGTSSSGGKLKTMMMSAMIRSLSTSGLHS
jgi:hypothetical protein